MAVQSPASRIPSHGTDILGQRYAVDLIRSDPRKGSPYHPAGGLKTLLFRVPTRGYQGWGSRPRGLGVHIVMTTFARACIVSR